MPHLAKVLALQTAWVQSASAGVLALETVHCIETEITILWLFPSSEQTDL